MSPSHAHSSQCCWEEKFKRLASVAYTCLSQAISAPQKSHFLSSPSLHLGWNSSWLWQAPWIISCGHKEQSLLLVLLCMKKKLFWINFAPLHVIRKQKCLWLCLVKASAREIVVSRQPGFVADKHKELYWLTSVYPSYSNFYSEQNETANLSSPNFLQRFVTGLEMPQTKLWLETKLYKNALPILRLCSL